MKSKAPSVIMLGAGFIGQMHALSVRLSEFALGGVRVNPRLRCLIETPEAEAAAKGTAARFGFEELSVKNWTDVLAATEGDLLINAGPNNLHIEPSIAFARQGKHVFCEKPLARTADEAFAGWQGVAGQNVQHMCAYVHRFIPAIQLARNIIRAGDIGEVLQFRSQFLLDMRSQDGSLSWRFSNREAGAGATGDLGSHHIDIARFLLDEVVEIGAFTRTISGHGRPRSLDVNEDSFIAIGRLANGTLATFDASRVAGGHALTGRFEVDGTRGSISFDMERLNELKLSTDRQGARTFLVTGPSHPYADFFLPVGIQGAHPISWRDCFVYQMHHMLKAVEHGDPVTPIGATFEDGYRVAEVVDTILASAKEGNSKPVIYRQLAGN
jgi:predicted dehydrogenase